MLRVVNDILRAKGLTMKTVTVVDVTSIATPSSIKNAEDQRDPKMHQTKKGKQWYFGTKAHIRRPKQIRQCCEVKAERLVRDLLRPADAVDKQDVNVVGAQCAADCLDAGECPDHCRPPAASETSERSRTRQIWSGEAQADNKPAAMDSAKVACRRIGKAPLLPTAPQQRAALGRGFLLRAMHSRYPMHGTQQVGRLAAAREIDLNLQVL